MMAHYSQELVQDWPGDVPGLCLASPTLHQSSAGWVLGGRVVSCIDEDVRVDEEHSVPFHRVVQRLAVRDVYQELAAVEGWQRGQGFWFAGAA